MVRDVVIRRTWCSFSFLQPIVLLKRADWRNPASWPPNGGSNGGLKNAIYRSISAVPGGNLFLKTFCVSNVAWFQSSRSEFHLKLFSSLSYTTALAAWETEVRTVILEIGQIIHLADVFRTICDSVEFVYCDWLAFSKFKFVFSRYFFIYEPKIFLTCYIWHRKKIKYFLQKLLIYVFLFINIDLAFI